MQQRQGVQLKGGVGEAGDSYERHADEVAGAVVRGESAAELLAGMSAGRPQVTGADVQRIKLDPNDAKTYTRLATLVRGRIPNCANDTRLKGNLSRIGSNTPETRTAGEERSLRDIPSDLSWGRGPDMVVADLPPGINGRLTMNVIKLSRENVSAYQGEDQPSNMAAHELLLESTILHEYTHFLDHTNRVHSLAGEAGERFEESTYGADVDDLEDASAVLNASFGAGMWTVTVEGNESRREHRVTVEDGASSTTALAGTVGSSMTVLGMPQRDWRLKIEHKARGEWHESYVHKVKEGEDNYLVRSENSRDRDMDDLEVRVTRLSPDAAGDEA